MFVHVDNNTYTEYPVLPKAFTLKDGSKTGNFDIMTNVEHKKEGFYPLEEVKPTFDERIEYIEFDSYEQLSTKVKKNFVKKSIPIEQLKQNKFFEIEQYKEDNLNHSLFEYDGNMFILSKQAADDATQLQTLVGLTAQFPTPFSWTDANGNEVPMNQAAFIGFASTLAAKKLGIIGTAKYHYAQIKALTDPLSVYNYDCTQNW